MGPLDYLKENEQASLEQLKELLRIPSVSAQSQYTEDVRRCAQWVADYIKGLGMKTEICETGGHPLVYGEYHISDTATHLRSATDRSTAVSMAWVFKPSSKEGLASDLPAIAFTKSTISWVKVAPKPMICPAGQ